jgi:hypothetical protein
MSRTGTSMPFFQAIHPATVLWTHAPEARPAQPSPRRSRRRICAGGPVVLTLLAAAILAVLDGDGRRPPADPPGNAAAVASETPVRTTSAP